METKNQFHRFGHMKDVFVKSGQMVKKGEKIATVGTGNGQWASHLHYDCPMEIFKTWTAYVFGWTKEEVTKVYADPKPWRMTVAPWLDHFGYGYLEHANYGTATVPKWCYHPGEDLNGKGSGSSDLGFPIYAPCDGEVVFVFDDNLAKDGGWGKLIVMKEVKSEEITPESPQSIESNLPEKQSVDTAIPPSIQPEPVATSVASKETDDPLKKLIDAIIQFIRRIIFKQ